MPRVFDGRCPDYFSHAFALVPNDGADVAGGQLNAIYVGGAGNVALDTPTATNVVFSGLPAGTTLMVAATRVRATGTTATNLIGLRG